MFANLVQAFLEILATSIRDISWVAVAAWLRHPQFSVVDHVTTTTNTLWRSEEQRDN